jgi:hypothetical protein
MRVREAVLRLRHSLEGEKPVSRKPALREEQQSFVKARNEGPRKKAWLPPTQSLSKQIISTGLDADMEAGQQGGI